jgi:cysteine protease ATG4
MNFLSETTHSQETGPNSLLPAKEFYRHFASLMWFTYRKDFPQVGDSDYTTDTGWGCMIRSAQMMLATGLTYYLLGRGKVIQHYLICRQSRIGV